MKKFILLCILAFTSISLVACDRNEPDPDPDPVDIPNGLEPLVATDNVDPDYKTLDGGWVAIWADEFDGLGIDLNRWNIENAGGGFGNNELQYYRPDNAELVDGKLVITAKDESYGGAEYTSAKLTSKYKGDFRYGRIQVRAKLAPGRGTWPAIWMMPTMSVYGGWPNSGEIDIMEYVGYDPGMVHTTIHTTYGNGTNGRQIGYDMELSNPESQFYTYEIIWKPGYIQTYVDGVPYSNPFVYVPEFNQDKPYDDTFPFDQQFYLILNLAIGGNWGGVQGVDDSIFPTTFEIDYVRVYQMDYASLDTEVPGTVDDISSMYLLENGIFWEPATDDYGVEQYEIYVDGILHDTATMNQYTFTDLDPGSYIITIKAVDFCGRVGDIGASYSMTIV